MKVFGLRFARRTHGLLRVSVCIDLALMMSSVSGLDITKISAGLISGCAVTCAIRVAEGECKEQALPLQFLP